MKRLLHAIIAATAITSASAQVDLGIQNILLDPSIIDTFANPDHILFDLLNYGPALNCDVEVELILSTNAIAGDGDDHVLGPVSHTRCLDPLTYTHDELSAAEKAQLVIPPGLTGEYHAFLRVWPTGQTDPNPSDNTVAFTNTITIPELGSTSFAVMANDPIVASNMTVFPSGYFEYNSFYGNNWRILAMGSGFTATFNAPASGNYLLRVRHGTSASASCPNNGYAPVTIMINGTSVVSEYDVAEHHNTYGYVNDTWVIPVMAGENGVEWIADSLCTHYWLQRVDLKPAIPPHIDSISSTGEGIVELLISAASGSTNTIETSTNLVQWTAIANLWNATGTAAWQDPSTALPGSRFYRVLQLGY